MNGHDARKPHHIPRQGWFQIVKRLFQRVTEDHVSVVSAGVAFFGLLAIFPSFTALVSIAGFFLDPVDVTNQLDQLAEVLPPDAAGILQEQVLDVAGGDTTRTGLAALVSFLLAYYGAVKGVKTLMSGLNVAYGEKEKRGFLVLNLTAVGMALGLIFGVLVSTGLMIVLPVVLTFFWIPPEVEMAVTLGRLLIVTILIVGGFSFLYRYAPSRRSAKWRWVSPGALIATVLWMIATNAFSIYAQNFGTYNETYGALGGVIVLLTWLWMSAYIVLLGATLNAEMEHQARPDTTVGEERILGQRGAVKADTLPDGEPTT